MPTTYRSNQAGTYDDPPLMPGGALTPVEFRYVPSVALVTGDIIVLAVIPKGVTLYGFKIEVPILGTTVPMGIGDDTSSALFCAAFSGAAAGRFSTEDVSVAANVGLTVNTIPRYYSAASDLRLTCGTVSAGSTNTVPITGVIMYASRRSG